MVERSETALWREHQPAAAASPRIAAHITPLIGCLRGQRAERVSLGKAQGPARVQTGFDPASATLLALLRPLVLQDIFFAAGKGGGHDMRTGYRSVWSAHEVNFGPANRILFLSGPSVRRKVGSPIVWRDQGVAGEMPVHQQCHPNTDQTRTKRTVIARPQIHVYPPSYQICTAVVDIAQADMPIVAVAFCFTHSNICKTGGNQLVPSALPRSLRPIPTTVSCTESRERSIRRTTPGQPRFHLKALAPTSPALFPSSLQHQQPNSGRLFAIQALRCATPHHALLCEAAAILHPTSFQFARRKP